MNMNIKSYSRAKLTLKEKIFELDFLLIIIVLLLGIISSFAMYSTDGGKFNYHTVSHIYRFLVFFPLFIIISFIRVNFWHTISFQLYVLFLILLILVEFFGLSASGSKRWIDLYLIILQPSELMKIGLIIFLARYYHRIPYESVNKIKYLVQPLFVILIPVLLVFRQPDLGTALLILVGGIFMIWLAGLKVKYLAYSSMFFLTLMPVAIAFLKPYQKLRILTFLNPERDPLGAGYQIIQSKIAVGSGGFLGKGFLQGTQSYLDYLPEKHTDFIFTLFSEEFGFVGSVFIILLYTLLIFRIILIGSNSRSNFSKLLCYGMASAIFLYTSVNIFMVLGLLPIVGSPLPIMSYGGSSMLSIMFGLGLVMSCRIHKDEIIV